MGRLTGGTSDEPSLLHGPAHMVTGLHPVVYTLSTPLMFINPLMP